MSSITCLALYFDAPLQSWGYASKFDRRTSLAHPTRSGVIGLLCAALGIAREDQAGLQRLDRLRITVFAFRMGGRLVDYHTVGGGYNPKREPQRICTNAEGGVRQKKGVSIAALTQREYLEDARFGVVVEGETGLIDELASALQNPVWGVWLGRKACVPAARLFEGVFPDEAAAREALQTVAGGETVRCQRTVREVECFADGNDSVMDRPLDFAKRRFASRRVLVE